MADTPSSTPSAAPSAPAAPAAPAAPSKVVLALNEPWYVERFESGVPGWDAITRDGTAGPAESAEKVIEAGVESGTVIERR